MGDTEDGKVAARYDFTRRFAIRGTVSNGFAAPTLAKEDFSALNVGPISASGDLAVNSAAARSIGAVPLKPERSTNASRKLAPPALQFSNSQFYQFRQTPVWLTDLEVGYQIAKRWHVALGGSDIFNLLPRETSAIVASRNAAHYAVGASRIPITGGFYYGRLNYAF